VPDDSSRRSSRVRWMPARDASRGWLLPPCHASLLRGNALRWLVAWRSETFYAVTFIECQHTEGDSPFVCGSQFILNVYNYFLS
jgi:hypothetical protein